MIFGKIKKIKKIFGLVIKGDKKYFAKDFKNAILYYSKIIELDSQYSYAFVKRGLQNMN